jgi:hypothetical protein
MVLPKVGYRATGPQFLAGALRPSVSNTVGLIRKEFAMIWSRPEETRVLPFKEKTTEILIYRGTSLIRNSLPPQGRRRALCTGLL